GGLGGESAHQVEAARVEASACFCLCHLEHTGHRPVEYHWHSDDAGRLDAEKLAVKGDSLGGEAGVVGGIGDEDQHTRRRHMACDALVQGKLRMLGLLLV